MQGELEMRLEATPEAVPKARRAMGALAEARGLDRSKVELAVAEAVANAVVHAFPDGLPGEVVVRASGPGRQFKVEVIDDGAGVRPGATSPGLGLGLPLIETLTREFSVRSRPNGGTIVTMRFEMA
ncbi:MAG: hypothetical protein QOG62_552 [Thermoleophilaceae bacterium]|jgi:anti-sigma regulatory factor (Ser/Thr protein kinase)|nr:hypothetical protein [Thermoleophilaceae bacterium]